MSNPSPLKLLVIVGTRSSGSALFDMLLGGRGRGSRLRYKDFTVDPFIELGRPSTELGGPVNKNMIADEPVPLAPNHLIGRNSVRFPTEMTIRSDEEFVSAMHRSPKLFIGAQRHPRFRSAATRFFGPPGKARR
jgi:hypothetical protein